MRRGLLVFNPIAGGGKRVPELRAIAGRARARGLELREAPTTGLGSATEIVRRALPGRPDLVVAAGGDTTAAEVAAALVGSGVPLAFLPTGTTSVVAREYGVGPGLDLAERHLLSQARRPLAVFTAAGRPSVLCVGAGFDARVMTHFPPLLKKLAGRLGYVWTSTVEWLKYEFPSLEIDGLDAEGRCFRRQATFLVAANTKRYAGNPVLSPWADPEDDLLDLVLFTGSSRATLFRFYQLLSRKKAEQLSLPGVVRLPVRQFTVRSLAGYEVEVQVDGEGCGFTPLTVGPALGCVQVVVPETPGAQLFR
ncbi:MAG: diacylglycerol/lipid kinase family protein [Acidithiobacillales bacterium]